MGIDRDFDRIRDQATDTPAPDIARHDYQPAPQRGEGDAWAEIIERLNADIASRKGRMLTSDAVKLVEICRERREIGIQRYGQPLRRNDGRDHDRDLREELLDAAAYAQVCDKPNLAYELLFLIAEEGLL